MGHIFLNFYLKRISSSRCKRRSSSFNTERIDHLHDSEHGKNGDFVLHYGDLSDSQSISGVIDSIKPDEVYNLAAQSHVRVSFDIPEYTADITAMGCLRVLGYKAFKFNR